jgi:hypothetical protein
MRCRSGSFKPQFVLGRRLQEVAPDLIGGVGCAKRC